MTRRSADVAAFRDRFDTWACDRLGADDAPRGEYDTAADQAYSALRRGGDPDRAVEAACSELAERYGFSMGVVNERSLRAAIELWSKGTVGREE